MGNLLTLAKFKKFVATLSLTTLIASLLVVPSAQAANLDNVPSWSRDAFAALADLSQADLRPAGETNKCEFAKILVRAFDLQEEVVQNSFTDVPAWAQGAVGAMLANNVAEGRNSTEFGCNGPMARAEQVKMVVSVLGLATCELAADKKSEFAGIEWASGYFCAAMKSDPVIITGDADTGKLRPADAAIRAESFTVAWRAAGEPSPSENPTQPLSGDLKVKLASNSPSSLEIPSKATSVEVLAFELSADENVVVNDIIISKTGVSTLASGFQGYLYVDGVRETAAKSLTSDAKEMSFRNLGWTVGKTPVRVSLRVDVGDTEFTGTAQFSVTGVNSDAATVGGLPVQGATHGFSTTEVGTVTVTGGGSITDPKVGEQDVTIAKFKLESSTEDALLKEFGLYVTGTISTDAVENLELFVSGQDAAIATVSKVSSRDVATFVLNTPYEIKKGDTRSFTVKADLNTGRTGDTLIAYVDESADVLAVGGDYGFGMKVDATAYDASTDADVKTLTLEGGDITISSNGPAARDIAVNADNVVLMNFNVVSVGDVTFKNFVVGLDASDEEGLLNDSTGAANLTDIKVINVDTGNTLMGPVDATSFVTAAGGSTVIAEGTDDNQAYYTFTDEFEMEGGESLNLALVADVANNSDMNGQTLVPSVYISSSLPEIRDANNKVLTNADVLVPTTPVTGKTATVTSQNLTLSLASTPVSDTVVKGSKDVQLVCAPFRPGTASDATVTDLTLTGIIDGDGGANGFETDGSHAGVTLNSIVNSVKLVDGAGEVIAAAKGVQTNGTVVFTDMNWDLEAGETQVLCVVGDISNDATVGAQIAFSISSTSNVTVEDADGNTFTPTGTVNTTPSVYMTVSAGGSLTVSVDPATAKENIAVAGSTGLAVSSFRFESTEEGFMVNKLSINNRQSAVTDSTTLGDYDNNVVRISLSYQDKDGATKTANGILSNGVAQFSGLGFYVPADDDATLTVMADLNTIQNNATAGEFVDFNIGFNNFEAVADSGETYKVDKLDAGVNGDSDLDFGTITWTNSGYDTNTVTAVSAAGSSQTVTIDTGSAVFPVGTLLFVDADTDATYDEASDSLFVTTAAWSTTTPTVTVANNGDASLADGLDVYYALPGTGYLTAANRMHVYETKPTITLDQSSPDGSASVASNDNAFAFVVSAAAQERVQWNVAKELATCALGFDASGDNANSVDAVSATAIDGSGCVLTQNATVSAGDTVSFDAGATGVISGYARANFWIRASVAAEFADIKYGTDTAANGAAGSIDNIATLAASNCTIHGSSSSANFTASTWYNCDVAIPTGTDSNDRYFHVELDEVTELNGSDTVALDRVVLYNDKLVVDLAGDDIDTQANGAHGLVATLKNGSTTLATGYVAKNTLATAEGGNASIAFFPISGTNPTIEVAKGTSKVFTVQLSTETLLAEDTGSDDPLTFSMDLGTSNDGSVTAGDIWWSDTNATVKWLGDVTNTKFSGNTVKY